MEVARGGFAWRVVEFAMHDDDWEVTRHHLPASLQPIRAEQISYLWFCCRYGIALGGDSDARHVTSQLGRRMGVAMHGAAMCGWVRCVPQYAKIESDFFSDLYAGEGLL